MPTIYHYSGCSTCKKALAWLRAHEIEFEAIDLVEKPPTQKTLKRVLELSGVALGKLFNTSGELYRSGGYKDRLAQMSESEALRELAAHGKLIKRPLLVGDNFALVGFKEAEYEKQFR